VTIRVGLYCMLLRGALNMTIHAEEITSHSLHTTKECRWDLH